MTPRTFLLIDARAADHINSMTFVTPEKTLIYKETSRQGPACMPRRRRERCFKSPTRRANTSKHYKLTKHFMTKSSPLFQSVCLGAFDCMTLYGLLLLLEQAGLLSSWQADMQACRPDLPCCPRQRLPQAPHLAISGYQRRTEGAFRLSSQDMQTSRWSVKSLTYC